jgi:antagonist of KipI
MTVPAGLRIQRITPLCQLQDLGRFGYQRFGVSRSGAMDPWSLRLANILVGNEQGEACLELALAGAVFEVTARRLHFAFVGNFPLLINGDPFPPNASYTLGRGERLEIGACDAFHGTHGYLAVLGGFSAKPQLGSFATHLRTGIGGFGAPALQVAPGQSLRDFRDDDEGGRPGSATEERHPGSSSAAVRDPLSRNVAPTMRKGVILPTNLDESPITTERSLPRELLRAPSNNIRAVPGPQTEYFSRDAAMAFFHTQWRIAPESDRMGYRLAGGNVQADNAGSMISEAVSPGSIQIPAGGQPIVLMADCGTVGGYPKIATLISVDRGRLAQMRVGAEFGFERVSVEIAQQLLREEHSVVSSLEQNS